MTGGPGPFEGPRVKSCGVLQKSLVLTSVPISPVQEGDDKIEYRAWNPFRSKLAAAILGGVDQIHIKPGAKVLYLGAASGTTVSHVSDIVGPVSRQRDRRRWEGGKVPLLCQPGLRGPGCFPLPGHSACA